VSKVFVENSKGEKSELEIDPGLSLMEHLRDAGHDEVQAICGGSCSCATCHVYIEGTDKPLSTIEEDELSLLELEDNFDVQRSRLSCQLELDHSHDGLRVTLLNEGF